MFSIKLNVFFSLYYFSRTSVKKRPLLVKAVYLQLIIPCKICRHFLLSTKNSNSLCPLWWDQNQLYDTRSKNSSTCRVLAQKQKVTNTTTLYAGPAVKKKTQRTFRAFHLGL